MEKVFQLNIQLNGFNNVERYPRAYSDTQDINKTQAAKVPRSAPTLSVKSKQSDASINRSKLKLELRQLKERQKLERKPDL